MWSEELMEEDKEMGMNRGNWFPLFFRVLLQRALTTLSLYLPLI
jgi:hypothetical protein